MPRPSVTRRVEGCRPRLSTFMLGAVVSNGGPVCCSNRASVLRRESSPGGDSLVLVIPRERFISLSEISAPQRSQAASGVFQGMNEM